ncbi:hypothetical protein AX17_002923 [Amanita inopinata Kibby_2008]|nr:hypothetical protein AX17_002923 [Amanita inopinata Kibby_2008]
MLDSRGILGSYHVGEMFFTYSRKTGDGTLGTTMILSLPQAFGNQEDVTVWWSPQDEEGFRIDLVALVEDDWPSVVCHAAKCAQYLFAASPTQLFTLLIGINQAENVARFFIFHRSGLTSCRGLNLTDSVGRAGFMKIMMTTLLWDKPWDAGYDPCCDNVRYKIPGHDLRDSVYWTIDKTIYRSARIQGRATLVHRLKPGMCDTSSSGTKPMIQGSGRTGDEKSLSKIIPRKLKVSMKHTPPKHCAVLGYSEDKLILKDSMQDPSRLRREIDVFTELKHRFGIPSMYAWWHPVESPRAIFGIFWHRLRLPEVRERVRSAFTSEVVELIKVKSVWEIFESIAHAMLGWLIMYQGGYLHRDISIGNVLRLMRPEKREAFKILPVFEDEHATSADTSIRDTQAEVRETAKKLKQLVDDLGISTECLAVTSDGDMAQSWQKLFAQRTNEESKGQRSGTTEFMSTALRQNYSHKRDYLQSPLDDIESFFWVALWAVLYNSHTEYTSDNESDWRHDPADTTKITTREGAATIFVGTLPRKNLGLSPIVVQSHAILVDLLQHINHCRLYVDDFKEEASEMEKRLAVEYLKWSWHLGAFRGVYGFLEIIQKHKQTLQGYGPFVVI